MSDPAPNTAADPIRLAWRVAEGPLGPFVEVFEAQTGRVIAGVTGVVLEQRAGSRHATVTLTLLIGPVSPPVRPEPPSQPGPR